MFITPDGAQGMGMDEGKRGEVSEIVFKTAGRIQGRLERNLP